MSPGNLPKNIIEVYRQKYSEDRKRLTDFIQETFILNPVIISVFRKIGWFVYQPYKWFFIVPLLLVSTLVLSIITILTALVTSAKTAGNLAVFWARLNSYFTPMSVKVKAYDNIDKHQSYIIVANHLSLYDIYVLYGWLGIDIRWVMKKELRKVPFLGFACKILDHIYIDRSSSQMAIESINKAKEKIKNGTSVIFFPEGTRSCDSRLQPFKKGAFKLAVDLGLPVLPVTINNTHRILGKGTMNLMPGTAEMIVHKPIDTSELDRHGINDLAEKARQAIQSELKNGY